jgi:hypothetical protein
MHILLANILVAKRMPNVAIADDFRQVLERAGLDPVHSSGSLVSRHTLWMPKGLVITRHEDGDDVIAWNAVEAKAIEPDTAARCIWDLVALRDPALSDVRSFIEKWGLLDFPEGGHGEDQVDAAELIIAAEESRSALLLIAKTEASELVGEPVLDALYRWDEFPVNAFAELKRRGESYSSPLYHEVILEGKREHWRVERSAGRGLVLQRRLLMNFFNGFSSEEHGRITGTAPWVESLESIVTWDERGRRVDWEAYGVRGIVGAHMLSVLVAPQLDVFICSVCGNPFPFDPLDRKRRPKTGRRQTCSTACKEEARRADNRASWHKNKSKWTRSRHGRQGA